MFAWMATALDELEVIHINIDIYISRERYSEKHQGLDVNRAVSKCL